MNTFERAVTADLLVEILRDAEFDERVRIAKRLAGRAMGALGADGVTIMQSNGGAAWQTVFHYHVHVIPRYHDDPLKLPWTPGSQADSDELDHISQSYSTD